MLVEHITRAGVAHLTLNRPDVHNALNPELIDELEAALVEAGDDGEVRLIVLRGRGRSFCSGADLAWFREQAAGGLDASRHPGRIADVLDLIVNGDKPVIACVRGAALGGGVGLAAACDLVAADATAKLGLSEVRLGLVPAMILPYLMRRVPIQALRRIGLTGLRFGAEEAARIGLVDAAVDDVDAQASRWSEALMAGGPRALAELKRLLHELPELSWEAAQTETVQTIARVRAGDEAKEGIGAFFEKRPAAWIRAGDDDET